MQPRSLASRRFVDRLVKVISAAVAFGGIFVLAAILTTVVMKGAPALGWDFFTERTASPKSGGGMANAILGTLLITILATLIGVPVGMLAGVYLSEFGKHSRVAHAVRFASNVLLGTPSILLGVFVYTLLVVPANTFSGYAGAVALAIMMFPIIARTTEEMLNLVPDALRESALALGAPQWRVTLSIVFRAASGGLLTGVLLAVARISGETAPLLFTALNSTDWPTRLSAPTANLTVSIFNRAMSPYPDWQQMAWGASLLITMSVLATTIVARLWLKPRKA